MRDLVTLQIQSCAQEAAPHLLVSLTDLMGKLRPRDSKSSPGSILCQRQGQHLNRGLQPARPVPFRPQWLPHGPTASIGNGPGVGGEEGKVG